LYDAPRERGSVSARVRGSVSFPRTWESMPRSLGSHLPSLSFPRKWESRVGLLGAGWSPA
ncbi:MAG: hypothetical protein ACP5M0_15060, partial [Desulfomonilaceae bacterium]